MYKLGLTGGIGSGKPWFVAFLKNLEFRFITPTLKPGS